MLPVATVIVASVDGLALLREPSHRYGLLLFGTAIVVAPVHLVRMCSVYAVAVRPEQGRPDGATRSMLEGRCSVRR